jgi:predicted Zn-ribbon and HTH transcriptional regulator
MFGKKLCVVKYKLSNPGTFKVSCVFPGPKLIGGGLMSIDSDAFQEMFATFEATSSDEFDEPPVRSELIEPPIRSAEPPPSKQELEAAAADELLKIAAAEEKDLEKVRKSQQNKDTFVICCPKGCRIRVKEKHRGQAGKCPRCQSEFVVPKKAPAPKE